MIDKIKQLYWTKEGFKPFPNLFVWIITLMFLGWVLRLIF